MSEDLVLILNSAQATSVDLTTGSATFILGESLSFQDSAVRVAVNSFSFTNFFLNISAALANNTIYYSDDPLDSTKYSITIPDGSYSITSLNSFISGQLLADAVAPALFEFLPDYSQNKVYVKWGPTLSTWFLSMEAGTPYTVLGFDLNDFVPAGKSNTVNEINYAPNAAAFNNVESVNVKTNLANNIILSTGRSNVLYQTVPTVSPGSIQKDEPNNLLWATSATLSSGISEIKINITDQNDTALPLQENFVVVLQMRATPVERHIKH